MTFSEDQLKKKLLEATECAKTEDLENAVVLLKQILDEVPHHEVTMGMLASIYLQIGMHRQSIELFENLLAKYPKNPLARFQLGMARLTGGEPQEALDAWAPMLQMENEFMANFHSALALMQLGRFEEALPLIERARSHMPDAHPLYSKLMEIRAQIGNQLSSD